MQLRMGGILGGLTFDVRGRRSGEAAKGPHKRSLWAVLLDGIVRAHFFTAHEAVLAL